MSSDENMNSDSANSNSDEEFHESSSDAKKNDGHTGLTPDLEKLFTTAANLHRPIDISNISTSSANSSNTNIKKLLKRVADFQREVKSIIPIKKREIYKDKVKEFSENEDIDPSDKDEYLQFIKPLFENEEEPKETKLSCVRDKLVESLGDITVNPISDIKIVEENIHSAIKNLREIESIYDHHIKEFNGKSIHIAYLAGHQLSKLKELHDNQGKEKKKVKLDEYVHSHGIKWSRSHIYFFLDFYKLANNYHKLLKCKMSISFMKANLGKIKKIVEEEETDYWKEICE